MQQFSYERSFSKNAGIALISTLFKSIAYLPINNVKSHKQNLKKERMRKYPKKKLAMFCRLYEIWVYIFQTQINVKKAFKHFVNTMKTRQNYLFAIVAISCSDVPAKSRPFPIPSMPSHVVNNVSWLIKCLNDLDGQLTQL